MVTQTGLVIVIALVILALGIGAAALFMAAGRGGGLGLVQQQLDALRAQLGQALGGQAELLGQEIARLTAQVGERLDHTARVVGDVQRGLGELREATARVYDVGRDVVSLHDILRAPKLRGGLGELLLGDLLAQVLPAGHFTLQHTFRSGERVDAVVRLGPALVPVDAKFPLEDFRRLLEATDDEARARARKAFVARVRKHIDDVAAKYILPDEGTYDFALMYVPAENVYYEAIVRDDGAGSERSLAAYALERKVMPVSPNSFYGYLQAIVLGLRGLRIEARAQEVIGQLARLAGDLGRLQEDFRVLGRHVTNAAQAHAAADRRLDRLTAKLAEIAGGEEAAPLEEPLLRAQ